MNFNLRKRDLINKILKHVQPKLIPHTNTCAFYLQNPSW